MNTHLFDLKSFAFCPKFSQDSYIEFQQKNILRKFLEILCKPRLSFFSWKIPKKFTLVLSYVVCTLLSWHVHKKITKGDIGIKGRMIFFFRKAVLFTLGWDLLRLISMGLLVWNFYQTFIIVCIEFWMRFEPQIHPTRFAIIFLFITRKDERKVRLCVKQFDFFRRWILICLTWNLSCFVPNSFESYTWNFNKKIVQKFFSEILCKPRV